MVDWTASVEFLQWRLTTFARGLRRRQTDVEAKLWSQLRDRRLAKLKFRRQVPIGPYIADFVCEDAMLIVELDGSHHNLPDSRLADDKRTQHLNSVGYQVVRVWNSEINTNIDGVLTNIYAVAAVRTSLPSPDTGEDVALATGEGLETET
jgi:very-short-patch-repair endonuclease